MENRDPSIPISRPDERRREEARIARASLARPLADPEPAPIVQGDSTFSRVSVPSSQLDEISKSIRLVLGPYHEVLGGPATNGLRRLSRQPPIGKVGKGASSGGGEEDSSAGTDRLSSASSGSAKVLDNQSQSTLDTGQPPKHSSSSSTAANPPASFSSSAAADSKQPAASQSSHNQSSSSTSSSQSSAPNKPAKPPLEATLPGGAHPAVSSSSSSSTSQHVSMTSSSSPIAPVLSPGHSTDIPMAPKDHEGNREPGHIKSKERTPPPPPLTAKHRTSSSAPKSPVRDASSQQQMPSHSHSSSKSKSTSSSSSSKDRQRGSSPSHHSSAGAFSGKDHSSSGGNQSSSSSQRASSPPLSASASQSHRHSISPPGLRAATITHSSPSRQTKAGQSPPPRPRSSLSPRPHLSPSPRPRSSTPTTAKSRPRTGTPSKVKLSPVSLSTTPTKSKTRLPNGVTVQHSKPSTTASSSATSGASSSNVAANGKSSTSTAGTSTDKTKPLTLVMPTLSKPLASKSDLNDIFKEMTELQAPLTAIETPQKVKKEFPFSAVLPANKHQSDLVADLDKETTKKKTSDSNSKTDIQKDDTSVKKENDAPKEDKKEMMQLLSSSMPSLLSPTSPMRDQDGHVEEKTKVTGEVPTTKVAEPSSEKSHKEASPAPDANTNSSVCTKKPEPRSRGKTISEDDSILMRDLDLSDEDSDAEPTSEDNKTSASQSKKGKVIASTPGAPVKRATSPMSSSSNNSSSESSSESDGDDDDDDNDREKKGPEADTEKKKPSESRLSSSGSNSSSDSSSDSGTDDDDDEDEEGSKKGVDAKKPEAPESKTIGEKRESPSPPYGKGAVGPASVGTPGAVVQENSEASMSWRLDNFIHPSKKNSNSPANQSPFKTGSPPMSLSAPPSVQPKEESASKTPDQSRPRTLKDIGQCETMPFDMATCKNSDLDSDDNHADEELDDVDDEAVFRRKHSSFKRKPTSVSANKSAVSSPSPKLSKHRKNVSILSEENNKRVGVKESQASSSNTAITQKGIDSIGKDFSRKTDANGIRKDRKGEISPVPGNKVDKLKTTPSENRKKAGKPGSSSDDEIDVVSFTPDQKSQHHLMASPYKAVSGKGKKDLTKILFNVNGDLTASSDEDSKASSPRGKNAPTHHIKHHRRKNKNGEHNPSSSSTSISNTSLESSFASTTTAVTPKSTKKLPGDTSVAMDHLESISRPPNLLLPRDSSSYSPTPGASVKPLPPFRTSFSPAPLLSSANMPSIVTLNRNADGTSRPRILVQIRSNCMSEKTIRRLKEKRDKRNSGGKSSSKSDSKPSESLTRSESLSDSSKEPRVPPIPDRKLPSQPDGTGSSIKENRESASASSHSISSPALKPSKRKSHEAVGNASEDTTSSGALYKIPKHTKPSSKEGPSSSSTPSSTSENTSSQTPSKTPSSLGMDTSSNAAAVASSISSSHSKPSKLTSPNSDSTSSSSVFPNKASGSSSAVKSLDFTDDIHASSSGVPRPDKLKIQKRKPETDEDSVSKKSKVESIPDNKVGGAGVVAASIGKRRDSTASTSSKGSHKSVSSKKSRRSSTVSNKSTSGNNTNANNNSNNNNNNNNNNSIDKTNGSDGSNLPFNHYVNGNGTSSSTSSTTTATTTPTTATAAATTTSTNALRGSSSTSSASSVPEKRPPPSPIETQLLTTDHYLARAREHKHHADNLKDKPAKFEPYLRSGLSFFLAGYTMELGKKDPSTCNNMYNETSNLLKCVIRMKANSSSNPESSDRERKLIVLMIRLQAYLNHRIYRLRRGEVSKLKKVIESEQSKLHSSSSTTAATSSSSANSKPHAPSPHQSNWNKNSTGTPSPMSPTPSPAGSVSSQGSCEHVSGKIPNGTASSSSTPMTSPSPGMVSVQQRLHAATQKYFTLTSFMVKAMELWDQADADSRGIEDFFTGIDSACGPLSFHSEPLVIVRYMKYALRLLTL